MGIIKRQGLKTSIVSYAGVLLGVIFFIFVFPHIIDKEYLGLIGLLQNLMYIFASLPGLGMAHIMLRYYALWKEKETLTQFNAFSMLMMLGASILFVLAYILCKDLIIDQYKTQSALFIPYYYAVIPLVIVYAYSQYFEIYSMMRLRVAVPAFLREILTRVLLIIVVYLFAYKLLSEYEFVGAFIIAYLFAFAILVWYTRKQLHFKANNPLAFVSQKVDTKESIMYGGYMLLLTTFTNIHNFLDGIILPAYLGLGALGIYLRPMILGVMIQIPYRAISLISIPIIREAIVQNDMKKVKDLNRSIGINLFLIGSFLFTLLIANTNSIFKIFPPEYEIAKNVLYIIALGRLLDMAFGLNSEIINYSKYYRHIILFSFVMMMSTIALNILLIPKFGMEGAALAVSISLIVFNIMKTVFIWQKFHFHCFSKHYISLLLITSGVLGILYFIPFLQFLPNHMFMNACANIVFKSGIGTTLFIIPLFVLKISPDFNEFVKLVLTGKIFKGGHKMESL
ncbi:MAG: polysaccharide biosynthesis C-terminal domain-containing protein [Bacteroidetes bacterium]|nr:polysaccharide biosynthesis C-terminal domain-containing protein [Bacteroidota bacterium]